MLPTKGYFQDIDCPYYDSSCGRPYCHFRHKKKQQDIGNDSPKESEIPTYKPTPKSQLANNRSHIPISYVPDLAFRPERTIRNVQKFTHDKPTYKPTPLSVLSCVSKQEPGTLIRTAGNNSSEKEISSVNDLSETKDSLDSEYCPTSNIDISVNYTPSEVGKPLENESENEYKPTGDNSNFEYKPTSNIDNNFDTRTDMHYSPSDNNHTNVEYHPTPQPDRKYDSSTIDFEDLDNEFDMIDEIISDSNVSVLPEQENADKEKRSTHKCIEDIQPKPTESSSKIKVKNKPDKTPNEHHHKHPSKHDKKSKSSNKHEKEKESSKSRHESKHGKSEHKREKVQEKSLEKTDESKSKRKDSSKTENKKEKSSEKSDKSISRKKQHSAKHADDRKESKGKSSNSGGSSSHKNKHKSHEGDREKPTDKHSNRESEKSHHHHHKTEHKISSKSKEEKLNSNKKHKSKRTSVDESDTSHKKRRQSESDRNEARREGKDKTRKQIIKKSESESDHDEVAHSYLDDVSHFDLEIDSEDDETMQECYRIFNEYKPPETVAEDSSENRIQQRQSLEDELFVGKKRVAHTNAENIISKFQPPPISLVPSAAHVMTNRFKAARAAQASNEQNNIMAEVKNISSKRPAPPSLAAAMKNYKMQKTLKDAQLHKTMGTSSLIDDILSGTQKTNNAVAKFSQRKIAPVSNVMSMQKAKERIEEMKQKTNQSNKKTTAQIQKGAKRVAHVPEFSLADIPDVLQADKSKLPVNVRTRFLTMIADECGKLYLTKEDAYTRALNEEFSCYEKCKVLTTYKNSAMLAVNRIRKEHQERTKQGLGPLFSGEDSGKDKSSEFKGKKFYDNVKKYLLTDEELDIHGYPKESNIPGKAVIKNRKQVASMRLEEYQRKCARCSKIYVVDEDGFAFYDEECLYHPLKKRTLRGEQTYLCCKSNDDTGCSTSHTHVSDCPDDSELEGYQTTMDPESESDVRSTAVYALDCEMCYTTKGLELTRVTIIDSECKMVYDTLVKPLNPIIDYNTRFSGITKEQMDRTSTSILQVQANILHLCNSETILIGHSLESDMKALKIIHGSVVDTSVLFPHRLGLPHKRALRALASEYLKKIIQNDISGHDSSEDAITCMELIKWKLKEELKVRGIK